MPTRTSKSFGIAQGWADRAAQSAGPTPGGPDFTIGSTSVATAWDTVTIGELIPNAASPAGVSFVLVGEPAGLAVVNG